MKTQGNIVPFSIVGNKQPIIDTDANAELMNEAFAWALETQRAGGFYSDPVAVHFNNGDVLEDGNGNCMICLFVNEGDGTAILRREWKEEMCLKFNRITNLDEIKRTAPESYNKMVQNGLNLYSREGKGFKAFYLMEKRRATQCN